MGWGGVGWGLGWGEGRLLRSKRTEYAIGMDCGWNGLRLLRLQRAGCEARAPHHSITAAHHEAEDVPAVGGGHLKRLAPGDRAAVAAAARAAGVVPGVRVRGRCGLAGARHDGTAGLGGSDCGIEGEGGGCQAREREIGPGILHADVVVRARCTGHRTVPLPQDTVYEHHSATSRSSGPLTVGEHRAWGGGRTSAGKARPLGGC